MIRDSCVSKVETIFYESYIIIFRSLVVVSVKK